VLAAPRRDGAAVDGENRRMDTADELKHELAAARAGGARLFPIALRQRALEYAAQRGKAGATVSGIARELGVKPGTLMFWRTSVPRAKGSMRLVVVKAQAQTYSVVGGHGVRIDGLSLDEVASLFGKLG
jgi:transposase-like protein